MEGSLIRSLMGVTERHGRRVAHVCPILREIPTEKLRLKVVTCVRSEYCPGRTLKRELEPITCSGESYRWSNFERDIGGCHGRSLPPSRRIRSLNCQE